MLFCGPGKLCSAWEGTLGPKKDGEMGMTVHCDLKVWGTQWKYHALGLKQRGGSPSLNKAYLAWGTFQSQDVWEARGMNGATKRVSQAHGREANGRAWAWALAQEAPTPAAAAAEVLQWGRAAPDSPSSRLPQPCWSLLWAGAAPYNQVRKVKGGFI